MIKMTSRKIISKNWLKNKLKPAKNCNSDTTALDCFARNAFNGDRRHDNILLSSCFVKIGRRLMTLANVRSFSLTLVLDVSRFCMRRKNASSLKRISDKSTRRSSPHSDILYTQVHTLHTQACMYALQFVIITVVIVILKLFWITVVKNVS